MTSCARCLEYRRLTVSFACVVCDDVLFVKYVFDLNTNLQASYTPLASTSEAVDRDHIAYSSC